MSPANLLLSRFIALKGVSHGPKSHAFTSALEIDLAFQFLYFLFIETHFYDFFHKDRKIKHTQQDNMVGMCTKQNFITFVFVCVSAPLIKCATLMDLNIDSS